ncbi:MAG: homoserine dehydrogenase [Thermodesulfovibrionia bacterium]|nr:homoserine dehydrogenase [Thermodesulfovibrionia bacterium]
MTDRSEINVGIIGFGTVGTGTARILLNQAREIERRIGFPVRLKRIADLDIKKDRGLKLPKGMLVNNVSAVINNPEIDIVVELIGGIHPAKEFVLNALKNSKHVVTANKALLATEGRLLFNAAKKYKVALGFEAAVAGAIPIIKVVRESMAGDRIKSIYGIINGTANYILSKMTYEGMDFTTALNEAKALGYAEADPTFDIEGIDSAHKIAILASLCFGLPFSFKKIYTEGITGIAPIDIQFATEFGYKIKLLAIAKQSGNEVEVRVHPTMLPKDYLISNVNGVLNAVYIESEAAGPGLYYGRGAGEMPTGNAVVSDIIDIARGIKNCSQQRIQGLGMPENPGVTFKNMDDVYTSYYLRLTALDKPGVLSRISGILGKHNISIRSMIQKSREKKAVPVVMMTHKAREKDMAKALREINKLSSVAEKTVFIRVEGEEE